MAFFDNLLAPFSTKPAQDAAAAQIAGIQQGYGQLSDLSGQGRQALTTNLQQGLAPVTQNIGTAQTGTNQLLKLLGIGPGGPQDMSAALQATPGYQFQLDQGTQAALRNAAAAGTTASGGTLADLMKYGQGLAGTTYQNAVGNLQPFLGYGTQAAGQNLQGYGQLGQGLQGSFENQGNAAFGAQTGIGNAQANAALAPYQVGNNIWGAIGNLAKLGTSAASGGMGGAAGNALFSAFSAPGAGGAIAASDIRLKRDISFLQRLANGIGLYLYRYIWGPEFYIGVIAQEVANIVPDAVLQGPGGFLLVDYDKLGM